MFDGEAFGKEIVAATKAHIDKMVKPLLKQIDAMKAEIEALKAAPAPRDGIDGKSITVDDVAPMILAEIEKAADEVRAAIPEAVQAALAVFPAGKDGKDADPEAVAAMVSNIISDNIRKDVDDLRAAVEAIPEPLDAASLIADAIAESEGRVLMQCNEMVDKRVELEVAALPPAEKGKDVDPAEVAALVTQEAERILAGWDKPQDGKSVTIEELIPLIEAEMTKAVASFPLPKDGVDGKDGRDGVDVKDLLVVEGGELVATFTDGRTKTLGQFRGKDGAPGEPGKDGAAGLAFEDMTEELADDGRTIIRRYTRGDQVKEFRHSLSIVLDRGVFKEGQAYQAGDGVTWGGSFWIAQEETNEKPEGGKGWRLAVKRGRDGKDAIVRTVNEKPIVKAGA